MRTLSAILSVIFLCSNLLADTLTINTPLEYQIVQRTSKDKGKIVVAGKLDANDVLGRRSLRSVEGSRIHVSLRGDTAFVNRSKILATDVFASNGVIHVIDTVLLPPGI
jgi:uncharacterized surface protein with fasciclin (FAS1) repeats